MSRRMDYTIEFDAPAEKIYQDFASREYWQTLMDSYRFLTPQSEITSFSSGERGTDITFVQNLPRMYLPPIARTVMPVDMVITRTQHFDRYDHEKNRGKGTYAASIPHGPGSFGGQYFLTDTDAGSRLRLASVCKVNVPFVGGALEDLILHHIKLLFDAEEAFTADWIASITKPVGAITRGTTGYNRLRRSDRWLVHSRRVRAALQAAADPLVIDLGYGALPVTTLELAARLRAVRGDVRVVGLEIHPERVVGARAAGNSTVEFALGGFELAGRRPVLVRAFNVLRQYPADAVHDAWSVMGAALAPGGLIVDGTCDELGRRCCWVLLDADGPVSLTLACDPFAIDRPSDLAERLPKVLIHHNVADQPIHTLLAAADRAWASVAGHGVFGPRVRWRAMLDLLRDEGFGVEPPRRRMRDGVLSVPWSTVAPRLV